jgi:hypothetical protein
MADQPKPKKPVPLGRSLKLTPEQLDEMSKVTPANIVKVQRFWRDNAPSPFETLLDAQVVEDEEKKP